MTIQEFKVYYDKLGEVYPNIFANQHKEKAVWAYIKDLDFKWWKNLAERMIVSSNPRFDIEDAARGERLARQKYLATKELMQAQERLSENISASGLSDTLKSLGVKSLLEAIEKKESAS